MTTLIPNQEGKMIDIDNISDAELGAMFRQQIKRRIAEKTRQATPQVLAQRAKAEAEQAGQIADRQAERHEQVTPGFMVGTHLVPDLDLRDVTDLSEVVSAKQRSVYNKALYRLKMDLLDAETTTYATLLDTHVTLRVVGEVTQPKKVKAVLAATAPEDKAKIKQVAEILGISKKEARKLVNA